MRLPKVRRLNNTLAALLITFTVLAGMFGVGELVRYAVGFDPDEGAKTALARLAPTPNVR